jgi:AraC-like DNA-binding protein
MLPFMQLAQFREIRPYVRFAHYTEDPLKVPSRYIRDHELILVEKGCGMLYTETGSFPYKEQSLLIIPPGALHSFKDDPDTSLEHAHWAVHFNWEPHSEEGDVHVVGDEEGPIQQDKAPPEAASLSSLWLPNMVRMDRAGEDIRSLVRHVVEVFRGDRPFRKLELQTFFLQLLLTLSEQLHDGHIHYSLLTDRKKHEKPRDRSDIKNYILKMHAAIRNTPVSTGILSQWQETVFFSAPHFHRLFKEQTGCSPHEYFTKLRMEKGALLLLSTKLPVQNIAYTCGYEDSKYFSRLFRQYEGFSPMQYRDHFLRQK